ncbi:hypothetical protein AMECASPLE_038719, partial [Ameca splendens]
GEGDEESQERECSMEEEITQETGDIISILPDAPFPEKELEKEVEQSNEQAEIPAEDSSAKVPKRIEVHSIHTYVALYRFLPQEQNDLEL